MGVDPLTLASLGLTIGSMAAPKGTAKNVLGGLGVATGLGSALGASEALGISSLFGGAGATGAGAQAAKATSALPQAATPLKGGKGNQVPGMDLSDVLPLLMFMGQRDPSFTASPPVVPRVVGGAAPQDISAPTATDVGARAQPPPLPPASAGLGATLGVPEGGFPGGLPFAPPGGIMPFPTPRRQLTIEDLELIFGPPGFPGG